MITVVFSPKGNHWFRDARKAMVYLRNCGKADVVWIFDKPIKLIPSKLRRTPTC